MNTNKKIAGNILRIAAAIIAESKRKVVITTKNKAQEEVKRYLADEGAKHGTKTEHLEKIRLDMGKYAKSGVGKEIEVRGDTITVWCERRSDKDGAYYILNCINDNNHPDNPWVRGSDGMWHSKKASSIIATEAVDRLTPKDKERLRAAIKALEPAMVYWKKIFPIDPGKMEYTFGAVKVAVDDNADDRNKWAQAAIYGANHCDVQFVQKSNAKTEARVVGGEIASLVTIAARLLLCTGNESERIYKAFERIYHEASRHFGD